MIAGKAEELRTEAQRLIDLVRWINAARDTLESVEAAMRNDPSFHEHVRAHDIRTAWWDADEAYGLYFITDRVSTCIDEMHALFARDAGGVE